MDFIFEIMNKTRVSLPLMVYEWTAEQQAAASIKTADDEDILTYDELMGAVEDHHFLNVADLYHKDELSEAQAATMIFNKYIRWRNNRLDGIRRAWAALHKSYNPLYDYEHFKDTYTDKDDVKHGKKVATETDITVGENSDVKTSHAQDVKVSTNTDLKNATNTDIKASTASNIHSAINTDIEETEGQTTATSKRPTWITDNQTTAQELTTPGTKHTTGLAADNYTDTTGTADNNYTQTQGLATNNYTQATGSEENNYSRTVGDETYNYDRTEGAEDNNYKHTEGDANSNYTEESGKTERTIQGGARHEYGYNGKPQESILAELEIARINFKEDLVREWVNSISYFTAEVM